VTDEASHEESAVVDLSPVMDLELPDDPEAAIGLLSTELAEARQSAESYLDDLKRVAADFDNFRKRALRDRDEIVARADQRLITALLPVLDSFDAALAADAKTHAQERVLAGMRNTHQQLMEVLAGNGLETIDAVGQPFDPARHEAVSGGGDGHLIVVSEVRRGYAYKGRVIRPALVQVAAEDVSADGPRA
jgi:molecular chaperone GrpE